MRKFIQKIYAFMQGRYGYDQLNTAILIVWAILFVLNLFLRNWIVQLIEIIPVGLLLFRMLSKNINKRMYENRKYLAIYEKVTGFFKLQAKKFKERKTARYIKCPYCKAQLRVPARKGKHTVRCPKCKGEFKKRILF